MQEFVSQTADKHARTCFRRDGGAPEPAFHATRQCSRNRCLATGQRGFPVVTAEAQQVGRTRRKTWSEARSEFLHPSGLGRETAARSWAAQLRLCSRFRRLAARKESKVLVATAIARELAGFLWAEMVA